MKKLYYLIALILITSCSNEPEKCESFKFGKFYVFMDGSNASYYKITRLENAQIELDTKGNTVYYKVNWLTKCSYVSTFDSLRTKLIPEMKMINEDGGFIVILENTPSRTHCVNYTAYVKGYRDASERRGFFCREENY